MSYLVVDLETTVGETYKRVSNCFDAQNYIVLCAVKEKNKEAIVLAAGELERLFLKLTPDIKYLVGQNFKFDLLWLWHIPALRKWIHDGGKIWDTQLAEYLLSGQSHLYPSLDELSLKYGGTQKDDFVKQQFATGVGSELIDLDILSTYAKGDVNNTELIFLKQVQQARSKNCVKFITAHMDFLLATTEMEYNGLHVDKFAAPPIRQQLVSKLKDLDQYLPQEVRGKFKWSSHDHLSCLLFGGTIEDKVVRESLTYKSGKKLGQTYNKYDKFVYTFKRQVRPKTEWMGVKKGFYSTSVKILECIDLPVCADVLYNRKIVKQINTYIDALPLLVQPDNKIHHSLHHVGTATTRLASSNPNLQNLPRGSTSAVKELFTSRYGSDGVIIEADAAQLEVCCAACVYQCANLINDILLGVDFHKQTAAEVFNVALNNVTKEQRTAAKPATFGVFYGNGAETLHNNTKLPIEACENYIKQFFIKYPGVKRGHDTHFRQVKSSRIPLKNHHLYTASGCLTMPYGCTYTFYEMDWYNRQTPCFKFTQVKDYPIQGLAAIILAVVGGVIFRRLFNNTTQCVMVNTVHDSLIFDCHKQFLSQALTIIKDVLSLTNELVESKINYKLAVPIKWDIQTGSNWRVMTPVEK